MNNQNRIENLLGDTLKNFSYLSDADTIVGSPIVTNDGATIIPISKMTVAFLTGGGEYGEVKLFQSNKNYPLSSGSGGIVSVTPSAFLVKNGEEVKVVSCPADNFEKAITSLVGVLDSINEKS